MTIDWTSPTNMVSKHFSVKEVLYLPQWNRMADANDGLNDVIKSNLIALCNKLDQVRDLINKPFIVHVVYRSPDYNKLIGGATNSSHCLGLAMDFHVEGMTCDEVKLFILSNKILEIMDMRLENNGQGASWIHLSNDWQPGHNRYFYP